ncbi:27501_t:CDS:10 [Dentiscutata erythropus]|uniref:27501_t:CDS:1 n=1 Tax=Dentiscutata erythropus TaxID=1348616 RepID=A0A9N9A4L3_9GLOM|nr:27501_t:CDS:10 [Dentiscutata erythropus]
MHSTTTNLPNKVQFLLEQVGDLTQLNVTDRKQSKGVITDIQQTIGSTYGGNYKLKWVQQPRSVFVVKKPSSESTEKTFVELINWLHDKYPQINIIIEQEVAKEFQNRLPFVYIIPKGQKDEYARVVDFIIALGGDGTILHVSSQFNHSVPPIISFSMGTLGFLLPFHVRHYESALESLIKGDVPLLLRMRLACSIWNAERKRILWNDQEIGHIQAMNEVNLHRGRFPHLTAINCFVDEQFLTNAVADGLIAATPTGSTAYSLSAGIILLTPICPRSLSFRPISLPPTAKIKMELSEESRSPLEVTVDGRVICMLDKKDFLEVEMSPYPIPCVNRVGEGVDWVKDINELLKWNQNFVNKQLLTHWW